MLSLCGIDVSKDRLDVIVLPEEQRSSVSNNRAGWADLVERLRGCSIAAIGLEASGGYERGVMRALLAGGLPVRQVNPFKLRQFARASGVLAKNDPLDARMIASFVGIMPTRPAQRPTPAAELVAEMLAVRRQLSSEKVAAENASRLLEDAWLRRLSRRRIGRLAADIELLDKRMVEIVATDAALAHRYRLLTSMPGVGPVLACTYVQARTGPTPGMDVSSRYRCASAASVATISTRRLSSSSMSAASLPIRRRERRRSNASSSSLEAFSAATFSELSWRRTASISASSSAAGVGRCAGRVGMMPTNDAIIRASSGSFFARTPLALANCRSLNGLTWRTGRPPASNARTTPRS